MKDIRFIELNANEQETLQGGWGYSSSPSFYNQSSNNNTSNSSASESQAQGQQGQLQGLESSLLGLL